MNIISVPLSARCRDAIDFIHGRTRKRAIGVPRVYQQHFVTSIILQNLLYTVISKHIA